MKTVNLDAFAIDEIRSLYYRVYTGCAPVKGALRSIICDLQRETFDYIPNDLFDLLQSFKGKKIEEVIQAYGEENKEVIEEYFYFLISNDYIFLVEDQAELALFPDIDLTWESPHKIENAIIDVGTETQHPYETIVKQLNSLGCRAVQFRFFCSYPLAGLKKIIDLFDKTRIEFVEFYLKFDASLNIEELQKSFSSSPRLGSVLLHSVPEKLIAVLTESLDNRVKITSTELLSNMHCGVITPAHFRSQTSLYIESQSFNSCLNRKVSIDIDGSIKNCPSFNQSYGNIRDTQLSTVLAKAGFKKLWGIHKDQIEVCKDCEFRYICSDCRSFTEDGELYGKPQKCNYNPYKGEWRNN